MNQIILDECFMKGNVCLPLMLIQFQYCLCPQSIEWECYIITLHWISGVFLFLNIYLKSHFVVTVDFKIYNFLFFEFLLWKHNFNPLCNHRFNLSNRYHHHNTFCSPFMLFQIRKVCSLKWQLNLILIFTLCY